MSKCRISPLLTRMKRDAAGWKDYVRMSGLRCAGAEPTLVCWQEEFKLSKDSSCCAPRKLSHSVFYPNRWICPQSFTSSWVGAQELPHWKVMNYISMCLPQVIEP